LPGVLSARYEVTAGTAVNSRKKTNIRAGYALVAGADEAEAEMRIADVIRWAEIEGARGA
jgi:hypothetical protein